MLPKFCKKKTNWKTNDIIFPPYLRSKVHDCDKNKLKILKRIACSLLTFKKLITISFEFDKN